MPDPSQLPFLIQLLDDESEIVRENVSKELAAYGHTLHEELEKLKIVPSSEQLKLVKALLAEQNRRWLEENWSGWRQVQDEREKLEKALSLLSDFVNDKMETHRLGKLLDELAQEYRDASTAQDALTLATFLFRIRALKGAKDDYLNPRNSDPAYVIEERRGIPISLACIYLLVGRRFGFDIEGINFPGHFLARAVHDGRTYIVDCFHGGLVLDEQALANLVPNAPISIEKILKLQCDAETIVARVLRNLVNAYQKQQDQQKAQFLSKLLHALSTDDPDE